MADSADRYDRRAFLARGATTAAAVGLAGVGLPTLLSSCGTTTGNKATPRLSAPGIGIGKPKRGGTITVGLNSEIDGFLPSTNHFDNSGLTYANSVYDTLTVIAADGSAKPYLAKSVTPNTDMTVWTITLASRDHLPRRLPVERRCRAGQHPVAAEPPRSPAKH